MKPSELEMMTEAQLDRELNRLAQLCDECEASMQVIRAEKLRRRDAEIADILMKLAQQS